jgi:NADH-quinone oxidoreductase subunit L
MVHAFFKSLLFLGAGVVILALRYEHNMLKMGGLARRMPGTCWAFVIGSASLAALPLVTAGFYSKDLILSRAWSAEAGGQWLWAAGLAGALLTSVYAFRMVFLVFFGPMRQAPERGAGWRMGVPLAVLSVLSLAAGFVEMPAALGGRPIFSEFLRAVFPSGAAGGAGAGTEATLQVVAGAVSLAGVAVAYLFFLRRRDWAERLAGAPLASALRRWWLAGWGFDWVYDWLLVRPFVWIARANRRDVIDFIFIGIARLAEFLWRVLSATQTGQVRWYAMGVAIGAAVLIALAVLL